MLNTLIVDDNKLARTALKQLCTYVDFITIVSECESPIEAFKVLHTAKIDLAFVDIEMPNMTGLELLENLQSPPIIIIISAKKDYAIDAFTFNVADYLVKPVSVARFVISCQRAKDIFDSRIEKEPAHQYKDYIFVRANGVLTKISLNEILYVQALGDYITIYTIDKKYVVHYTLKALEEKLPPTQFFRLQRSYIAAVAHISSIEDNTAYIGKHPIPIGEQYKKDLLSKLNLL